MTEMNSLTLNGKTYDCFVDGVARASVVIGSASGDSITVNDSSEQPPVGFNIYGKSTQAGTPTPDAPVDVVSVGEDGDISVGVYGKNLINIVDGKVDGFTIVNAGTKVIVSGTNANNYVKRIKLCDVRLCANVQYCLSGGLSEDNMLIVSKAIDTFEITSSGSATTYTSKENVTMGVYLRVNAGQTLNVTIYPQLEMGMTATSYVPYVGQTMTMGAALRGIRVTDKSLATYTEANGKMWCADEIDYERGVRIQRVKLVTLDGSEIWSIGGKTLADGSDWYYTTTAYPDAVDVGDGYAVCTHYPYGIINNGNALNGIAIVWKSIRIRWGTMGTIAEWKSWLAEQKSSGNPVTVIFRLAAPIETPLTEAEIAAYKALHTNKPNTTITNGENAYMSVKYIADAKSYIDNKVSGIIAATVE